MSQINFNDLWIGDLVWSDSFQRNVKWEGMAGNNSAQVQFLGVVRTVPLSDLSVAHEVPKKEHPLLEDNPPKSTPHQLPPKSTSIDLHIEILNPDIQHERAEVILEHQLKMCRKFIEDAILRRQSIITIIHGKGEGILRLEVANLLKDYKEFHYSIPTNNNGASEVWLRY